MTPSSNTLFKQALLELTELTADQRALRMQSLRTEHPELAAALEPLLDDALATTPQLAAPRQWLKSLTDSGLPERLGPWRVREEIGRGGMGLVLLGERADGAFDKQVAIKVLPPALVGAQGAARLAAEAGMLARLEHPHIARLLDAGFDGGCAYLVMEHVAGQTLLAHARERGLGLKARVALLLQLASAVQFAHAQLLVHRDLKPANVMVDHQGQVRLLDFGIAKVLSSTEDHQTLGQGTRQAGCTPAYASPEQLQGLPVSVASDVFSFGVLAWELLSGARPFNPSHQGTDTASATLATVRSVLEDEPDTRSLKRHDVPLDLSAVLLKALEKQPAQRYASVDALAADLRAFIEGRPVSARRPTWPYLAQRFITRHRWAVGGATLASSAVLGLAGWALANAAEARQQQAVAQSRLEAVRAIANRVVFDYNRALEPVPGTLEVRRTLVADALGYLNALSREAAGDDALLADVAAGFEAVGDVQGRGATGGNLGDLAGAQQSYERARALREPACEAQRVAPPTAAPASGANARPAGPGGSADQPPALPATGVPQSARAACVALARVLVRLGDNAFTQGRMPQALPLFDQSLAAAERALAQAGGDESLTMEAQDARFDAVQRLAGISMRQTGDAYARGLGLAQTQLSAAQALVALAPGLKATENLRVAQDFMAARLLADGRPDAALAAVQDAVATARKLQAMRPGRDATVYLATSLGRLGEIQAHRLQAAEARSAAREALDAVWALHQAEPEDRHLRARLANIGRRFGQIHNMLGTAPDLAANATELPRLLAVSAAFTPADGVFYAQHQQLQFELADTLIRQGDTAAAARQLAGLPAALPPNPRAAADLAEAFLLRAQLERRQGQPQAARATAQAATDALQAQSQATPSQVPTAARLAWARAWAAQWAQDEPAIAQSWPAATEGRAQASSTVQALADAQQLSPWWRRELAAVGGAPTAK